MSAFYPRAAKVRVRHSRRDTFYEVDERHPATPKIRRLMDALRGLSIAECELEEQIDALLERHGVRERTDETNGDF